MLLVELDGLLEKVELQLKVMEVLLLVLEVHVVARIMWEPSLLEGLFGVGVPTSKDQLLAVQHKEFHLRLLETTLRGSAWSEDLLELVVVEDASMPVCWCLLRFGKGCNGWSRRIDWSQWNRSC